MTKMTAIVQREYGGPEVLVPELRLLPEPASSQVRVVVAAAGVHLLDTVLRAGEVGPFGRADLPMTPGREVAGVVDAGGQFGAGLHVIGREARQHGPERLRAEVAAAGRQGALVEAGADEGDGGVRMIAEEVRDGAPAEGV